MVEFPLVVRRSANGLRRRLENLAQIPAFTDIKFAPSSRYLNLAGMWETSTATASFHARLNVAIAGRFPGGLGRNTANQRPKAGLADDVELGPESINLL
jgi:hypothetical protein